MGASTIFFNGQVISVPGSYTEVDASGLEQVGLGAAGIVAILGTAEGGKPVSAISEVKDIVTINKPAKGRTTFKSGDLREVMDMAFAPAKDEDILGGAQKVYAMKVNPATQSAATLSNASGDSVDLTSVDYGAFTEQTNITIAAGTVQGKLVTITFEDQIDAGDDIGGDNIYTLKYTSSTNSWATMTTQVQASGVIEANGTRAVGGLDSDVSVPLAAPGTIEIVSSAAGDTTQTVTVYGLTGAGAVIAETLTLDGTTPVVGTATFAANDVLGAKVVGTIAGTVLVRASGVGATVFSIAPAANPVEGMVLGVTMYVSGSKVTFVSSGASTKDIILEGTSSIGAVAREKIALTGTTPVLSVGNYASVTGIIVGDVEAAQTLTVSAQTAATSTSVQSTIQKVVDYFNARFVASVGGFVATMVTGLTTFDPANLDEMTAAVSCLDPAEPGFKADLWEIINWINTSSVLMTAAMATGAKGGAPSNTAAPVFLAGGIEGVVTASDWQDALNLLKQLRVNSIAVLTGDPSIHAKLDAHCVYMGGIGRSERDGFVGLLNAGLTDVATKTEIKAQIVNLNSRHIRAWAQTVDRYNIAGTNTTFDPQFGAAILAGMQAGSPVGTALTHKYMNTLGFGQDTSWNPTDDAEEMVKAGLVFCENVDGIGRRIVRNVTTHLSTSNLAFTEGSVNEAVNFAVFNFRTNMEIAVGKRGFSGNVSATKGVAIGTLGLLTDANILVTWRSLDVELIVDVLDVGVEIAPVIPINFVKSTIHLVTVRQAA